MVPDLLHMDYNEVMNYSEYAKYFNFEVVKFDYSKDFASNEIYEQLPEKETFANKGSTIQIYVSLGPEPVVIPDLTGKTYDEAVKILTELGFSADKISITTGMYPGVPVDTVYYQSTQLSADDKGRVSPESEVYLRINKSGNSVSSIPETSSVAQ